MATRSINNIITISRGDSFEFPLFINIGTLLNPIKYNLVEHENAKIYLGVMEPNQAFEQALIRQIYTKDDVDENGNIIIKFFPSDTYLLNPGIYYYEIKLKDGNAVTTVLPKTLFYII